MLLLLLVPKSSKSVIPHELTRLYDNIIKEAGAAAATTGTHFNATEVVSDDLGNAIGSGIVKKVSKKSQVKSVRKGSLFP